MTIGFHGKPPLFSLLYTVRKIWQLSQRNGQKNVGNWRLHKLTNRGCLWYNGITTERTFAPDGSVEHHSGTKTCGTADRLGTLFAYGGKVRPFLLNGGFTMKKVGIIMGSDSDLPVVQKAADTLRTFGVPYEMHVYSAHRTPEQARDFSANAQKNGFGVIIAAAGMAAHLAGALAPIPPCRSSASL